MLGEFSKALDAAPDLLETLLIKGILHRSAPVSSFSVFITIQLLKVRVQLTCALRVCRCRRHPNTSSIQSIASTTVSSAALNPVSPT